MSITTSAQQSGLSLPSGTSVTDLPVTVTGIVEHGNAWGRVLGFPTANVRMDTSDDSYDGVWAGTASFTDGTTERFFTTAVSVGTRPTYYADGIRLLEAFLLDFSGDLYDKAITVTLHSFVRPQVRYEGDEALVAQLGLDVVAVREWAAAHGSKSAA